MAKNTCECPNPPGGVAECEADQLAICRLVKGQIQTACVDAPKELRLTALSSARDRNRYLNWTLNQITGKERPLSSDLYSDDITVLQEGVYENSATGEIVKFRLPDSIAGDLALLMPARQAAKAY